MLDVRTTPEYESWFDGLRDHRGKRHIIARLERLAFYEHFGDAKPVGDGVMELRIDHGPGYRIYCKRIGQILVLLLLGGDKRSQKRDIVRAKEISEQWRA